MPPIRFAAAGPASVNTTAGLPPARAKPSQMSKATRSWRAYISEISSQSPIASITGQIDWPAIPAASVTPSDTSARLMAWATFMDDVPRCVFEMRNGRQRRRYAGTAINSSRKGR
jgi:hypothetical protein